MMIKEYRKKVRHNAIAHHPPTDALPVPRQQPLPPIQFPPSFFVHRGMEYSFGQFGSAVLSVSPPSFLCTSSLLAGGEL